MQENEKFSDNKSRKKNLEELVKILNEELIKKNSDEWLKIFDDNGLPCGPIYSITEMFKDKQTIDRKMIIDVENKIAGKTKAIGMPIKFSKSNAEVENGSPILGEHSKEILLKFGYSEDEVKEFIDKKIIL